MYLHIRTILRVIAIVCISNETAIRKIIVPVIASLAAGSNIFFAWGFWLVLAKKLHVFPVMLECAISSWLNTIPIKAAV